MIRTDAVTYHKALDILGMFLEFKKDILGEITKKVVQVNNIFDIFNKLDYIKGEINNLSVWDEWMDSYPHPISTALEFKLIQFISRSKRGYVKSNLADLKPRLWAVNSDLNSTPILNVGFGPDSLAKLDYAWTKYRSICIVSTSAYGNHKLYRDELMKFETDMDKTHYTVEKLTTLYGCTWYAELREMIAKLEGGKPTQEDIRRITPPPFPPPPLLPPPIHEPTAESMFNDFFPKKVDNAELLQALLGIHEELRGIRKALETK
jgi:hypothetical protein